MKHNLIILSIISIFFVALLNHALPVEGGTKATRPLSVKKNISKNFLETPFKVDSTKLNLNYRGKDIKKICAKIAKQMDQTKGEYETTTQYTQRMKQESLKPIIGPLIILDRQKMFVIGDSNYSTFAVQKR